jgi:hypothetical protein
MSLPRILFVGPALRYMNPTGELLVEMLSECGETTCFGPGFVSSDDLVGGLARFVDQHGPFDVAVTTELQALTVSLKSDMEHLYGRIKRLYNFDFPVEQLKHLLEISTAFRKLEMPKFLSLLQDDLYGWTERYADLASETANFFLGNGPENAIRTAEMQYREDEPWTLRASDVFVNFMESNISRFASFPLFVSGAEIYRGSHANRPNTWAVPGVQYRARRVAAMHLRSAGYSFRSISPSRWIHRVSETIGFMPSLGLLLGNRLFRRELERSRAVYTCGSVLQQPIRKFFEIPASGALLVSEPCRGLADYGFVDGVNCRLCSPEDVLEVDRDIRTSPDAIEKIARRGQDVVLHSHTLSARARQFQAVLQAVKNDFFGGARWSDGSYVISGAPAEAAGAARDAHQG